MPSDESRAPSTEPPGAASNVTLLDAINDVTLSAWSSSRLNTFIRSLDNQAPGIVVFFTYLTKYVEYNRARYSVLKEEVLKIRAELNALKEDVTNVLSATEFIGPQATPKAPPAAPRVPSATSTPYGATPPAPDATMPSYIAAPPAPNRPRPNPAIPSDDGTFTRRMGIAGNNVWVTFSSNDEIASKKAKLFGSSARMDTFNGQDMSRFPQWVAQFLSGVNLYQPSEPQACRVAIHLLRDKAAEMAKNISQDCTMRDLAELLEHLDRIFNTSGNRMVAVNLFNSFCQREDVPVQDYSIDIENLFYRAYPGTEPNQSIFLMDKFITGLVSPQIKEKLRTPPLPRNFREAVNGAMAFSAAIFPEHQTLRQRSLAWKMAASNGHPLSRPSHKGSSIQVIDSSAEDVKIQAIRQWCALHKTDKHSDSNCRAQQEPAPTNAAKKRPTGAKKNQPRRIRFKSTSDKKKFLRSIEEMEGVSLDKSSDDDDSNVVEQSLMQLYAESSSEESDEDEHHPDSHILVLTPGNMLEEEDVIMTDVETPCAPAEKCTLVSKNEHSNAGSTTSQTSVCTNDGLRETLESSLGSPGLSSDYAALSPSDIALLDGPDIQPSDSSIQIPKVEINPFSPDITKMDLTEVDNEAFPPLPAVSTPAVPQTTVPLPNGPVKINGIYYQPIPAPHNTVVATSSVSDPNLVAVASSDHLVDKPKVGLEFAMPEQPPVKRTSRRSRSRSRSSSRTRSKAEVPSSLNGQAANQPPRVRISRGRGKKMPNTPIQVPASHSHLMNKSKPKEGLRITFSTDTYERKVETTVQHLSKLSTEASIPLTITSRPSKETAVRPESPIKAQEDSDVDVVTGEISIPTLPTNESQELAYKPNASMEDCKTFAMIMLQRESHIWNEDAVWLRPDLFYESYFQDYQHLMDLRQKGNSRIQSFNVKVTRRDKTQSHDANSSTINREKLEKVFRNALHAMFEAFEQAFIFEHPETITHLRDELVNPAIAYMTNFFVSSRCRTCYKGRTLDAAWRRSRFNTVLPIIAQISPEAYRQAEEHQATVLLEKTAIEDDFALPDIFRLGFSEEDVKIIWALRDSERAAFNKELTAFVRINTPIRMSRRWDNQKDTPPLVLSSLNHAALQQIRQLRRQNLLPIAQALLHRFRERHENLIARFGRQRK